MNVDPTERRSALCVGVAQHRDRKLNDLPNAIETTRAVARAFGQTLFGAATVVVDPRTPLDVFDALQKAIRGARGGTFFLYFAGFVTDRDGDLMLVVGDTEAVERKGCVPWSDVEELLRRENVARAFVILNAERAVGDAPLSAFKLPSMVVSGAVRKHDFECGDADLVAYADALTAALTARADAIATALDDGVLDAGALDRLLARDATLGHKRLHDGGVAIAIRDLREELPKVAPVVEEPAPVVEEPAPVVEEPAPIVEEPAAPVVAEPAPVVEEPAPVVEEPAQPLAPAPRPTPWVTIILVIAALLVALLLLRR